MEISRTVLSCCKPAVELHATCEHQALAGDMKWKTTLFWNKSDTTRVCAQVCIWNYFPMQPCSVNKTSQTSAVKEKDGCHACVTPNTHFRALRAAEGDLLYTSYWHCLNPRCQSSSTWALLSPAGRQRPIYQASLPSPHIRRDTGDGSGPADSSERKRPTHWGNRVAVSSGGREMTSAGGGEESKRLMTEKEKEGGTEKGEMGGKRGKVTRH